MADKPESEATYFTGPREWRAWLAKHHEKSDEAWVGFYRKDADKSGITWAEAVDEALCVGWIDGRRRKVDDERYVIRFSPRKPGSAWSDVNRKRVEGLRAEGRMKPAGEKAAGEATPAKTGSYSYEQDSVDLPPEFAERLEANKAAAEFLAKQPASYRKAATWWVVSAKKEETRGKRFEQLLADSAEGRTVPPLTRRK